MAGLHRGCGLPVERHRWKRRRPHRGGARAKGMDLLLCLSTTVELTVQLDIQPLKHNRMRIPKSRYDSVDLYISESWMNRPEYNDNPLPIHQDIYDRMRQHGEFGHSC
jgi:hypothetical protein